MLTFPDNTKVAVSGLDDILAELYAENKKANGDAAQEIIQKLVEKNNFIPDSASARREYAFVLLREYRNYIAERSGGKP